MFDFNAKRRKTMASLFCLSLSFVLVVSCQLAPPVITLAKIANAVQTVATLIDATEKISSATYFLLNISYEDLGKNIRSQDFEINKKFSNNTIQQMEARHSELSAKHQELDNTIDKTNEAATELFSMLETRANQNTNSVLREKQLRDISVKEADFLAKIKVSEDFSLKLEKSIKEYDNILNFFQTTVGLGEAQKYIETVDTVISQYKILNQEVQVALNEGRQVITTIAELPPEQSTTETATSPTFTPLPSQPTEPTPPTFSTSVNDNTNTPENVISQYYQFINNSQYTNSWAMLSSNFQALKLDNDYNKYVEAWEKVDSVTVDSTQLIENSNSDAVVDVKLKYVLQDSRQLDYLLRFTLILNSNGQWLIHDTKRLEV